MALTKGKSTDILPLPEVSGRFCQEVPVVHPSDLQTWIIMSITQYDKRKKNLTGVES